MKNILYKISIILLALFVSCTEDVEFSSNTEALNGFSLSESTASSYVLNSGTPENTIELNWNNAIPGVSKTPIYKVLFFKAGSDTAEFVSFPSNNDGKENMLTITFASIDAALSAAGYAASEIAKLQWQVVATNGDVEVFTSKNNIEFVRFSTNGIKNFNLLLPSNNKVIKADIYGEPNGEVSFSWEPAATTTGTGTIVYTLLFDELGGNFSDPLKSFPITSGTSFTMTNAQIGQEFANNKNVIWTVKAKISNDVSELKADAKFVNWDIFIINKLYIVGSLTNWNPTEALPFNNIRPGVFELTLELADGDAFKFIPTNTSWDGAWKEDPNNPGFIINEPGDPNISGYPAGKYKITVDFNTFSFQVKEVTAPDNLYIIGSLTGWNPPTAFKMNKVSDGIFSLAIELNDGDAFKFIPTNTSWDGAWKEDPSNPGSIIDVPGDPNISGYPAGKYVAIVNFNTLTFKLSSIDNLYIIGSLTGWNPATAFKMNETNLGIWASVVDLSDGDAFKFIPTNSSWNGAWKEDPNNPGSIIDEAGDPNISGYAPGKYVIAVNFNTLSFTVSPVTGIPENLFLVGQFNGWNEKQAPAFTKISSGVFQITQALTGGGDGFKFLPQQDWPNDWGKSKTSKGVLEQGTEDNVKVDSDGTYTITVDFTKGTYSVN